MLLWRGYKTSIAVLANWMAVWFPSCWWSPVAESTDNPNISTESLNGYWGKSTSPAIGSLFEAMLDGEKQDLLGGFFILDQSQFLLPLLINLVILHYDLVIYELTGAVFLLHPADVAQPRVGILVDLCRTFLRVAHQLINNYHCMKQYNEKSISMMDLKLCLIIIISSFKDEQLEDWKTQV